MLPSRLAVAFAACLPAAAAAQTPPPPPTSQHLSPLPPNELAALRPLAARGAAALVYYPDAGPGARVTVAVPVRAPLALVRRAIAAAEEWPQFMPALRGVELLSRHARRSAYRFTATGPMMDVSAVATLQETSPTRVDLAVLQSDVGTAAARWDLVDDGDAGTLVVVTSWCDASQSHWLLRRAGADNPTIVAGMHLAVDLALALAVGRRAVALGGASLPVRPAAVAASVAPAALAPPPRGPWMALGLRYYVLAFATAPDGTIEQVTEAGQTWAPVDHVVRRVDDVAHYADHMPGVRSTHVTDDHDPAATRFGMVLNSSWDRGAGELVRRRAPGDAVVLDGASGDYAGLVWRWDVWSTPEVGTLLLITGGVGSELASVFSRVATSREPYLQPGLAALRNFLWLRYVLTPGI